ncbi:MAG: hypothetical protein Q9P01_09940 [Anaerolineae bacterium]|nr:hypothetical protein [Anaerolineae bacterium]
MALNERIDTAYAALLEQLSLAKVLLLHPRSKYRSVLLAMLVNDPDVKTFYYALGPDDINWKPSSKVRPTTLLINTPPSDDI